MQLSLNEKYWKDRQDQLWSNLEKDEDQLIYKLSQEYDKQLGGFDKEIASYFSKYGKDNVLEYSTLMQSLSPAEKTMAIEKWADFTNKYPEYAHLAPVRESIYKFNRLQGLQNSVLYQQVKIGVMDIKEVERHLIATGTSAIRAGYVAQGMSDMMNAVNPNQVSQLINQRWVNGQNFSDRIWNNKAKLTDYLQKDFATGVARGDSYDYLIKGLRQRFKNVSEADARRLVYTEGTFVMNEAMIKPFEDRFEEYKFVARLDSKTSEVCQAHNGLIFKIKEREAGVNFPPLHARCRSTFEVVIPNSQQPVAPPPKVTGGPKNPPKPPSGVVIPQPPIPTFSLDKGSDIHKALGKVKADELTDMINSTQDPLIINFWNKYMNQVKVGQTQNVGVECYKPLSNDVHFNASSIHLDCETGPKYEVLFHEMGHWADNNYDGTHRMMAKSQVYNHGEFTTALKSDIDNYIKVEREELRTLMNSKEFETALKTNDYHWFYENNVRSELYDYGRHSYPYNFSASELTGTLRWRLKGKHSKMDPYEIFNFCDILGGATKNKYGSICGHTNSYWKNDDKLPAEAFAEMLASRTANKKSYEMLKKMCPQSMEVFERMLEEMSK